MNTRVKLLRSKLHMSQGAFGKRLGVTGAGISKIENGKRNLTEQMLLMICREFNVNEDWLKLGEGEVFLQKFSDGIDQFAHFYLLDELDKRIILEYAKLDNKKRSIIKEYIMNIAYGSSNANVISDGSGNVEVLKCAEESDAFKNNIK